MGFRLAMTRVVVLVVVVVVPDPRGPGDGDGYGDGGSGTHVVVVGVHVVPGFPPDPHPLNNTALATAKAEIQESMDLRSGNNSQQNSL